jgi:hypothetical protein
MKRQIMYFILGQIYDSSMASIKMNMKMNMHSADYPRNLDSFGEIFSITCQIILLDDRKLLSNL